MDQTTLVWFRQDLRISDNLALVNAAQAGKVFPIFVFDKQLAPKAFLPGSAHRVWLHHALNSLNHALNGKLNLYKGSAPEVITALIDQHQIHQVVWNQCFEPWHLKQEAQVKRLCKERLVAHEAFNSNYLWLPDEVLKDNGDYYKVFSAYKRKAYLIPRRKPVLSPRNLSLMVDRKHTVPLKAMHLIPKESWVQRIEATWEIGEKAAKKKLARFRERGLPGYKVLRDHPGKNNTSRLSPHLHFGEISPLQICEAMNITHHFKSRNADTTHFLCELTWREFSCYLLYHTKSLHQDNINKKFDRFPWTKRSNHLSAWQTGQTGYPLVDAGMRELWQTGYMHNRVRMVVASFLVKNLNIHWHLGRDWFWDCLVDADLANNSASWQWVAGCGADAAPYFRIFNPTTQGEKFDKNGAYTRQWVPELKDIPDKHLFKPWEAPEAILAQANITLGETYPLPIVDLRTSRENALAAYKKL